MIFPTGFCERFFLKNKQKMRVSLMKNSLFFKARPGVLAPLKAAGRPPPHPPRISVTPVSGRPRDGCGVVRFLGGAGVAARRRRAGGGAKRWSGRESAVAFRRESGQAWAENKLLFFLMKIHLFFTFFS
jgi:hypothetical protein